MIATDDRLEVTLSAALKREAQELLVQRIDLWPGIHERLERQPFAAPEGRWSGPPAHFRHTLAWALCVLTVLLTASVALAASPAARDLLGRGWPFRNTPGYVGTIDLQPPAPPFRVFSPGIIPRDEQITAHFQARPSGGGGTADSVGGASYTCPVASPGNPRSASMAETCIRAGRYTALQLFPPVPVASYPESSFLPELVSRPVSHGASMVWRGWHAVPPERSYIEISEWNLSVYRPSIHGRPITIGGQPAILERHGAVVSIRLDRDGTGIWVRTIRGEALARRLVASLHPVHIVLRGRSYVHR